MIKNFTQQYSLAKTLRFELKPVGETVDYIEDFKSQHLKDFVKIDQQRADDYLEIKKLIDDYHRDYIQKSLSSNINIKTGEMIINYDDFNYAFETYKKFKKDSREKSLIKEWEDTQKALRKKLVSLFVNKANLFKKELITQELPNYLKQKGEWDKYKAVVETFNKFTTYFTGFHENRKNMYSDKDQSTAIAYRLMNENLPRFFDNCISYENITSKYETLDLSLEKDLQDKTNISNINEVFKAHFFINLFTQTGIDNYQLILGGYTKENGEKVQGLNEKINQFRQNLVQEIKDKAKKEGEKVKAKIYDLSGFTELYKQILSDRETASFIPEEFSDDKELLDALSQYIEQATSPTGLIHQLQNSLEKLNNANLEKVYIKAIGLSSISQLVFKSYNVISQAIEYYANNEFKTIKLKENYKKQKTYNLNEIDAHLYNFIQSLDDDNPIAIKNKENDNSKHIISIFLKNIIEEIKKGQAFYETVENLTEIIKLTEISKQRRAPNPEKPDDKGGKGFIQIQKIQATLDAFLSISHALKPFHLVDGRKPINLPDKDNSFYSEFVSTYEEYSNITIALYNKVRNHLTKKAFTKNKIKLNFNAPTLLNGWDENKESDNSSLLFRKNGVYYLGIMHPKHKHIFNYSIGINDIGKAKAIQKKESLDKAITDVSENGYEKIVYKLLPGANKMLPKVFFSNSRIEFFSPSKHILQIRNTASHSKNGNPQKGFKKEEFNLNDCHAIVDFFKSSLKKHPEWNKFNFKFSDTTSYNDLSQFYREVEHQGYKVDFHNIKESYINECIEQGKLFLFQIYNKDFSKYSKGTPNLHTLYWKALFEKNNLKDVVIKLNGEAEIFYRKHSIKHTDKTIHKAKEAIINKNSNNPKKESVFEYDIVKNKRFTQDKFQFHVPITLNFKATGIFRFNDKINSQLAIQNDTCVIGIDRGERHLLYYTVINSKGQIIEQDSLNSISTDQGYKVDYQQKLHQKEKQRDKARKSWTSVENIKELKAGYLSHVVHKLALLIEKHNAIVCLEDLNFGFKRGRFKVEKQVYQKFEKALIDKLNYLVFKNKKGKDVGGYLNAYQLTAPFESFEKLGKQSGILFYVNASYTSKICPATGFIDFLRPYYKSLNQSKIFFESIDCFKYNSSKGYFEMEFDYKKTNPKTKLKGYKTKWTICTHGSTRYQNKRTQRGDWETETIDVTQELKRLFTETDIKFSTGNDLLKDIILKKETKFYKTLFFLLKLTLSLRHSKTGTEDDFILSPVADDKGEFYDSRKANHLMPKDADANGAYNIALKGLWNLQKIKAHDWEVEKPKLIDLKMSNEQWFEFAQKKLYEN